MTSFSLMHFFAFASFFAYLSYTAFQLLPNGSRKKSFSKFFLAVGLVVHAAFIFLFLRADLLNYNDGLLLESNPSVILLVSSFIFFFGLFFYPISSNFLKRVIGLVAILVFSIGSLISHESQMRKTYELSCLLVGHIFVSIVSQVLLLLLIVFSFLLAMMHRDLKDTKMLKEMRNYPALVPTEHFWYKLLQISLVCFALVLLSGFWQAKGFIVSYKIFLTVINFIGLVGGLLLYNFSRIGLHRLALFLGVYLLSSFMLQIAIRSGYLNL